MFEDRIDAGNRLAQMLAGYQGSGAVVLGIARGGAAVGARAAEKLGLDFGIVVVRKLPLPEDPEAGFGAIAEDGSVFFVGSADQYVSSDTADRVIGEQKEVLQNRIRKLRGDEPLPGMSGKTVIAVDDGIAMGSTMAAAVMLCKNAGAEKVIAASPVASQSAAALLAGMADEVVIVEKPPFFRAVAQVYRHWRDLTDEEVSAIVKAHNRRRGNL